MQDEKGKESKNEKKLFVVITFIGWVFFIALFIGRAIGIIATHDDVGGIGDFVSRLDVWSSIGFLGLLIALTIGVVYQSKRSIKE